MYTALPSGGLPNHNNMTPEQYCKERTSQSGSSFTFSFLFLPPERREAMTALYAFCREVDDVVDEPGDPALAHTRLAWWREEIGRLYHATPQHPVTRALAPAVARYGLAEEHFLEIVDGMAMDLDQVRYASFRELSLYCYRVASVVGLLSAEIFGYENRQTLRYAHDLGMAFQLTNILRDVGEDARRGRIYLPQEELDRFGVDAEALTRGEMSEAVRALFRFQAERARRYYQSAFSRLPEEDRYAQRAGIIMAAIYLRLLDAIETRDFPVLRERISLSPWRKLWLAWRTARREAARQRRRRG